MTFIPGGKGREVFSQRGKDNTVCGLCVVLSTGLVKMLSRLLFLRASLAPTLGRLVLVSIH